MAGILDFINGDNTLTPGQVGLLGAAAAMSQAYAPQPASRLPLARPTLGYLLGQAAGGYGQGYGTGQQIEAQRLANQLTSMQLPFRQMMMGGMMPPAAGASGAPTAAAASPVSAGGSAGPLGAAPSASAAGAAPFVAAGAGGAPAPSNAAPAPPSAAPAKPLMPLANMLRMAQVATAAGYPQIGQEYMQMVRQSLIPGSTLYDDGSVGLAPGVPEALQQQHMAQQGYNYDPARRAFVPAPGLLQGKFSEAQNEAAGKASVEIPANRQKLTDTSQAEYGRGVDFGPPQYFGAGTGGQASQVTGAPRPLAFKPSPVAPAPQQGASTSMEPQSKQPNFMTSQRGTAVPNRPMDEIPAGTKNYDQVIKENEKIIPDWDEKRELLDTTANRLEIMARLLKDTQSGAFSENRAEWANKLNAIAQQTGSATLKGLAQQVATTTDMNAIKRFEYQAYQEVLNQLKTVNHGAGGRILKVEVETGMEKGLSADMPPGALYGSITDTLGQVYRARNLIDDFHGSGWVNAGKFASAWLQQPNNSLNNHQEYARNFVGPFKGMAQPAAANPAVDGLEAEMKKRGFLK